MDSRYEGNRRGLSAAELCSPFRSVPLAIMSFRGVLARFPLPPYLCGATATARRMRSTYAKAASRGSEGQMLSEGREAKAQAMEKKFWMRDPSTGDWVPEDHIGCRVDAAELREKLLSRGNHAI